MAALRTRNSSVVLEYQLSDPAATAYIQPKVRSPALCSPKASIRTRKDIVVVSVWGWNTKEILLVALLELSRNRITFPSDSCSKVTDVPSADSGITCINSVLKAVCKSSPLSRPKSQLYSFSACTASPCCTVT